MEIKHYCPNCNSILQEGKICVVYICPNCGKDYMITELNVINDGKKVKKR